MSKLLFYKISSLVHVRNYIILKEQLQVRNTFKFNLIFDKDII